MTRAGGEHSYLGFTVVIPVRNGASTLDRCIRSIRREAAACDLSAELLEIVVVDNGSSDDSAVIAGNLGCRVFRIPAEDGVSAARNRGAREARGAVIVFTDADVIWCEGSFSAIRKAFESPEVGGIVGVQNPGTCYPEFPSRYKNLWMAYTYLRLEGPVSLFYTTAAAIRRDLFFRTGGFDETYRQPDVEDTELGQRLRSSSVRVIVESAFMVHHEKRYSLMSLLGTDFRRAASLVKLLVRRLWGEGVSVLKANTSSVPTNVMIGVIAGGAALAGVPAALLAGYPTAALVFAAGIPAGVALHAGFLCFIRDHAGPGAALQGAGIVALDLGVIAAGMLWGGFTSIISGGRS